MSTQEERDLDLKKCLGYAKRGEPVFMRGGWGDVKGGKDNQDQEPHHFDKPIIEELVCEGVLEHAKGFNGYRLKSGG